MTLYQNRRRPSRIRFCRRPADTARLAAELVRSSLINVWLLRGPLGSGKTTFVRGALRALGYRGVVPSPTFSLSRAYLLSHPRWRRLVHVDAYRLRHEREEAALNIVSAANDPRCLLVVEWPDKLKQRPWSRVLRISFAHHGRGRRISF
ncbi:MAG: tRNA (adenosine(37)-N6)-threonylcarbamoyltransferase complex ATPase subunit type 1 TsaE [Patescibacteria group bacterium]